MFIYIYIILYIIHYISFICIYIYIYIHNLPIVERLSLHLFEIHHSWGLNRETSINLPRKTIILHCLYKSTCLADYRNPYWTPLYSPFFLAHCLWPKEFLTSSTFIHHQLESQEIALSKFEDTGYFQMINFIGCSMKSTISNHQKTIISSSISIIYLHHRLQPSSTSLPSR